MKIKNKFIVLLGVALVVGIVGCAPADNEFDRTGLNNNTQNRLNTSLNNPLNDNRFNNGIDDNINNGNNLNNGMTRMNNNVGNNGINGNNLNSQANDLARRIGDLPEVDSASVVINNNTVLVGLRSINDRNNTNNMKNANNLNNTNNNMEISNSLRTQINEIVEEAGYDTTNIQITSDPDLFNRIEDVSRQTVNSIGNLGNDVIDEIENIIDAINPRTNRTIR